MFGIKNKKRKGRNNNEEPVNFSIETMASDLKKPYQKKDTQSEYQNSDFSQPVIKREMEGKETADEGTAEGNKSPFLSKEAAIEPTFELDQKQSFTPEAKNTFENESTNNQSDHEKEQVPNNLPISDLATAEEVLKNDSESKEINQSPTKKTFGPPSPDLPVKSNQTDENELFSQIKESNIKSETSRSKKAFNLPLVLIAGVVLLLTLFAGAYYFFFTREKLTDTEPFLPPVEEEIKTTPPLEPNMLDDAAGIGLVSDDLVAELKTHIGLSKTASTDSIESGSFFTISTEPATTSLMILEKFGISLNGIEAYITDKNWLFLDLTSQNVTPVVKTSLIFEVSQEKTEEELIDYLKQIENELPEKLLGLFLDEESPVAKQEVVFAQSSVNSQFRYYNYGTANTDPSVDWGIINYQDKLYLIFTTSKNSTVKLINKLNLNVNNL